VNYPFNGETLIPLALNNDELMKILVYDENNAFLGLAVLSVN